MRTLRLAIIVCLMAMVAKGQNPTNAWINYSQKYFKFPVPKEGVYRLDSSILASKFDLSTLNPKNLQIFIKGKEQFIHVQGESDGKFNNGDYLEFYTDGLVGELDSLIYTNISYLPNPYKGLFNDTLYAFITANNSLNNKRFQVETDTTSAPHPEGTYMYARQVFTGSFYNLVYDYNDNIRDPLYTQAEGFGALGYNFPGFGFSDVSATFTNLNAITTGSVIPPSYLAYAYSGYHNEKYKDQAHWMRIYQKDANNNSLLLSDTMFDYCKPIRQNFTINTQSLTNSSQITFSAVLSGTFQSKSNYYVVHFVRLTYPRLLSFSNNAQLNLFATNHLTAPKQWYRFTNINTGTNNRVLFYDLSNGRKIQTSVFPSGVVKVLVPSGSSTLNSCILLNEDSVKIVPKLIPVNGSGSFIRYNNGSLKKPFVIVYNRQLKSSTDNYINYRNSASGGGYDVIAADVDDLYEQFSQGVNKHPVAIRQFLKFLYDSLPSKPMYAMIIGKGIEPASLTTIYQNENLVPVAGVPGSDYLFCNGFSSQNNYDPYTTQISIGRIAALNNTEVNNYLAKVQSQEQSGDASWKKNILHFTGGDDENLLRTLTGYMKSLETVVTDTLFGAKVTSFSKNTTSPIQTSISDSVFSAINRGCALLNFFGHGSESNFDQAIDDPNLYNNSGKHCFLLANSCNSGNIYIPTRRSVSERFINTAQKGAIGFLSTISYGYDVYLYNYSYEFYKALSGSQYHKGVGDVIREAIRTGNNSGDQYLRMMAFDMALNGDPSMVISPAAQPDYVINNTDLGFDLNKYTDSLGIRLKMKNTGRAVLDSFAVRIKRFFPNGDSAIFTKTILSTKYSDSLKFFTPIDFTRGFGLNSFTAKIDYFERIAEGNENNNATIGKVDLFIPGGDILPVYPYKYAIVPKTTTITLKASTTDPFAPLTTYRFELDTNDSFKKPLQVQYITSKGGVLEWTVDLPFKDSTVYFWRVSRDSLSAQKPFSWRESSFQTIGTKRGWGQAHFHQFKNDEYQFVTYKKDLRKFTFENNLYIIEARTGFFPYINFPNQSYYWNGIKMDDWSCNFNGWNIAVFDSVTGRPQAVRSLNFPNSGFGPYGSCVSKYNQTRYQYMYGYFSECGPSYWKQNLQNLLNSISPGNYVLAYSTGMGSGSFADSAYNNSLYQAFESFGSSKIRSIKDSTAMIIFGKKGQPIGSATEVKGNNRSSIIYLKDSIQTRWRNGYISSEIIGPSSKWNSLHWRVKSLESGAGDTTVLKLVGIRNNGKADTLQVFKQDSTDVLNLQNYVDASIYPFLKLVAFMEDNVNTTSPQLKRWQVLYDEAPECAINPLKGFASINDSLQEGDQVTFRFPIENIGVKNFEDSLVVTYWIEDNQRNITPLPQKMKSRPFVPGQLFVDTVQVNTYQFLGNNALWIHVNPLQNNRYQHEQYQFNNIGRYPFKVRGDVTNPLLDVTFDGIRILNGDIVSAKPGIHISLKDENKFLALNDTGAFTISLKAPGQSSSQRIYFGQGLVFTPASLPKNSCSIEYNPVLPLDGRYTLMVQAKDRSANKSAVNEYRVDFEVNNKPTITGVLNYPNPFTSSTRFVFTLTGSEIPEVLTIQIMTISGKIVREITRDELGTLRIGRNITEFAWDGRDMYGDRLGNGVYLYRVISKLNGENLDKNASGADKFMTREFGKMVLIR